VSDLKNLIFHSLDIPLPKPTATANKLRRSDPFKVGIYMHCFIVSLVSVTIHPWEECDHTTNFNVRRNPPVMLPKLGRLRIRAPAPELLRSLIYSRVSTIINIHALAILRAALCTHIQVRRVCALVKEYPIASAGDESCVEAFTPGSRNTS
jgi:hypothetical protein